MGIEGGDLDKESREDIIRVMDMRVRFDNKRVSAFFTDTLQRLSFSYLVYLITRPPLRHIHAAAAGYNVVNLRRLAFTHFAAAQNQHRCHKQSSVPRYRLCHCCRRSHCLIKNLLITPHLKGHILTCYIYIYTCIVRCQRRRFLP